MFYFLYTNSIINNHDTLFKQTNKPDVNNNLFQDGTTDTTHKNESNDHQKQNHNSYNQPHVYQTGFLSKSNMQNSINNNLFNQDITLQHLSKYLLNNLYNNINNFKQSTNNICQQTWDNTCNISIFNDSFMDSNNKISTRPTYIIDYSIVQKAVQIRYYNHQCKKALYGDLAIKLTDHFIAGVEKAVDSLLHDNIISIQKEIEQMCCFNNYIIKDIPIYKAIFNYYVNKWIFSSGIRKTNKNNKQLVVQIYSNIYNTFIKLFFQSPHYWTQMLNLYLDINPIRIIVQKNNLILQWYFINILNRFFTTEFLNNLLSIVAAHNSSGSYLGMMLQIKISQIIIKIYIILIGSNNIEYKISLVYTGSNNKQHIIKHKPLVSRNISLNWSNYKIISRHKQLI